MELKKGVFITFEVLKVPASQPKLTNLQFF